MVVGRAKTCQLRIAHPGASKEQTVLWWEHDAWWARDLGSRNGTWVEGRRLSVGEVLQLDKGAEIAFAVPTDAWILSDDSPPTSTDHSDLDRTQDLEPDPAGEPRISLQFKVSPDEEFVEVTLFIDGQGHLLEARTYHYMLLTLARAVKSDAEVGIEGAARGWLYATDLAKMLKIDERTLNVHVFRVRRQVEQAGLAKDTPFLERLGRLGQIRLAVQHLDIHVLDASES
ncbi:MAG: FHA domain-containing protein [Myxococcota bacterium]